MNEYGHDASFSPIARVSLLFLLLAANEEAADDQE